MRFERQKPYKMLYKEILNANIDFNVLNFERKHGRGRPQAYGTIKIPPLYPNTRKVQLKKKQDMLDLLPFILAVNNSFFLGLQTAETVYDDEEEQ